MRLIICTLLLFCSTRLLAAGAVVGEPGSCMIEFGIYTAHFTVYQPDSRGNEEFCEDLPDSGNSLFVLNYLHGSMKTVPVEFRIIRDVDELGIFARWDNVAAMEDIEASTVFYQPPTIHADDQLTAEHNFLEPGAYIGVISAPHPSKDLLYHAVFPFSVGRVNVAPWILLALVLTVSTVYFWRRRSRVQS